MRTCLPTPGALRQWVAFVLQIRNFPIEISTWSREIPISFGGIPQSVQTNTSTILLYTLQLTNHSGINDGSDARRITAAEMKYVRRKQDTLGQITKQMHRLQRS